MNRQARSPTIGVGATDVFIARVSAATLLRLLFRQPETQQWMLALEHIATLHEETGAIVVKAKPFGGGVQILNPESLYQQLNGFHYDSLRSKEESDFRVFVRAASVKRTLRFCLDQFERETGNTLESSPHRELLEEIADTLGQQVSIQDFQITRLRAVAESKPAASSSPRSPGSLTVRAYNIFQAEVLDPRLAAALYANSQQFTADMLTRMAAEDRARGGRGRSNAVLALPWDAASQAVRSRRAAERGQDFLFGDHWLSGNVGYILDD